MKLNRMIWSLLILGIALSLFNAWPVEAQVNPAEIHDPHLRALEKTYFKQLIAAQRQIEHLKLPYPFSLDRYVGLDPSQEAGSDKRGLEFVKFHNDTVLKITGNYSAAFNADLLSENQRADQVFAQVAAPILKILPGYFSSKDPFEKIGLEIAYHVRRKSKDYEYEGKEILVVVMDRSDALGYGDIDNSNDQQALLNRSEIYLNGKRFGLALGKDTSLELADLDRIEADPPISSNLMHAAMSTLSASNEDLQTAESSSAIQAPAVPSAIAPKTPPANPAEAAPSATQADADQLQSQYQSQLDALGKEGAAKMHFVDYAPPSFIVFKNHIYLQVTLRNPTSFDAATSSIYRRTAQTFDLFLAPLLKPMLDRISPQMQIAGMDIAVINPLHNGTASSSEAVEFISPMSSLRQFTNADITNQTLIDQSIVMVNGVRIGLNLQQVE